MEAPQRLFLLAGIQGEHGRDVRHGPERILGLRPYPLRGRIGGHQLGEGVLERLESAEEPVVLRVGDLRPGLHVVEVVMPIELPPELARQLPGPGRAQIGGIGVHVEVEPCHGLIPGRVKRFAEPLKVGQEVRAVHSRHRCAAGAGAFISGLFRLVGPPSGRGRPRDWIDPEAPCEPFLPVSGSARPWWPCWPSLHLSAPRWTRPRAVGPTRAAVPISASSSVVPPFSTGRAHPLRVPWTS